MNIICFGSEANKLFNDSVKYNSTIKDYILDVVSKYAADLGGTEVLSALELLNSVN